MKKISVAVCLDEENGMMFNNRRQSRDRVLIRELVSSQKGDIYIHPYSQKLFSDYRNVVAFENPFEAASDGDVVFVENIAIAPYLDNIDTFIVYKWNRLYPADVYFDIDLKSLGFKLRDKTEFEGSSHEKITKEIYQR